MRKLRQLKAGEAFLCQQLCFLKLKNHRNKQNEMRMRNGLSWENHDLVFCSELGTPHSIPNLTYRYFRPILNGAKLPQIRLYDLRHSHATLLLIAEENPKVVAERLGRSTVVLTLDTYSHVLPTMQKAATDKLDKCFTGHRIRDLAHNRAHNRAHKRKKGNRVGCPKLLILLEAAIGIEPMNKGFADLCLTTWLRRQNDCGSGVVGMRSEIHMMAGFERFARHSPFN